ncbi:MAG: hypothetical protein ABEJ23_00420 [Haloarculaceae archaeon]
MVRPSRRTALRIVGSAGVASVAGCTAPGLFAGPNERVPDSLGTTWTPPADE